MIHTSAEMFQPKNYVAPLVGTWKACIVLPWTEFFIFKKELHHVIPPRPLFFILCTVSSPLLACSYFDVVELRKRSN